jgi:hypothetical protein
MMLAMIAASIVLEWVLPSALKQRLGTIICWGLMFITMSFLTLSTVGLVLMFVNRYLLQA